MDQGRTHKTGKKMVKRGVKIKLQENSGVAKRIWPSCEAAKLPTSGSTFPAAA